MGQVQADQRGLLRVLSAIDELLRRAGSDIGPVAVGDIPAPPAQRIAIVTCMDARISAKGIFGLDAGDAHVIRNAGGVVTDDVIRSLAFSQHLLGTREVMVVQHTGCGLGSASDQDLLDELPDTPAWEPRTFADLEESVRDGVQRVRSSPYLAPTEAVRGFVFDIDTGTLREVS